MFDVAVVLAGGEGTRMRPLTNHIPKALVEVNGKELIRYPIDLVKQHAIQNIYATYSYKSDKLLSAIHKWVSGVINTTGKDNSYFLGQTIIKHIDEAILVLPCDMIIDIDLTKIHQDYLDMGEPANMIIGVPPCNPIQGDFIQYDSERNIVGLSRDTETEYYCSGLQVINPKKVNAICGKSENFYAIWRQLIIRKEIKLSNIIPENWACYDSLDQII